MNAPLSRDPFVILTDIERRSRRHARGLPQQREMRPRWAGIGYRVGQLYAVSAVGDVAEMIKVPALTRVPGVQPWVKGVANMRGRLVPVLDVRGSFGGGIAELTADSRALIVESEGVAIGLLVDQVLGLRHFDEQERVPLAPHEQPLLGDYVDGAFEHDGFRWAVLDIGRLATSAELLNVAL